MYGNVRWNILLYILIRLGDVVCHAMYTCATHTRVELELSLCTVAGIVWF